MTNPLHKSALIMAGGTGGHIFPGLAIAEGLLAEGWQVAWLGSQSPSGVEASILAKAKSAQADHVAHIDFKTIQFGGLRGKGLRTMLQLPITMVRALWQSYQVLKALRPSVVIGMGGYISFPAGLMARVLGTPLVLHEQNSVAGLANKVLARLASRVFTAFPGVLPAATFIGNPLRTAFKQQAAPAARFAGRTGVLDVLVVGGSLGAKGLNDLVPKALALIPLEQRPRVTHQSGAAQLEALQANYLGANVAASCIAFIDDTAHAYANADIVIARSGASTVTEMAAVGAAALFVPFPFAVDDHQTTNAKYLVNAGAAWTEQQADLTPQMLADFLQTLTRETLLERATAAHHMAKTDATEKLIAACEQIAAGKELTT